MAKIHRVLLCLLACAVLAACGGGDEAEPVASQTGFEKNREEIVK